MLAFLQSEQYWLWNDERTSMTLQKFNNPCEDTSNLVQGKQIHNWYCVESLESPIGLAIELRRRFVGGLIGPKKLGEGGSEAWLLFIAFEILFFSHRRHIWIKNWHLAASTLSWSMIMDWIIIAIPFYQCVKRSFWCVAKVGISIRPHSYSMSL